VAERMATFEGEAKSRAITHIVEGRPYEEIVRLATEKDVDLIIIGTSVHSSIFGGAPVLGPDIERVVRNSPCPVLSVPSGKVVTPHPVLVTEPVPQT
jgi:nucleotide-binding universal stress UspA family protein